MNDYTNSILSILIHFLLKLQCLIIFSFKWGFGEVGRAALGGQSGVTWSWPQRQHTQKGRLAMRLWVGRICGLWAIPMVKLVSGGGSVGTGMGSGIGCSG